jgi:hypothetical protein
MRSRRTKYWTLSGRRQTRLVLHLWNQAESIGAVHLACWRPGHRTDATHALHPREEEKWWEPPSSPFIDSVFKWGLPEACSDWTRRSPLHQLWLDGFLPGYQPIGKQKLAGHLPKGFPPAACVSFGVPRPRKTVGYCLFPCVFLLWMFHVSGIGPYVVLWLASFTLHNILRFISIQILPVAFL